jgi:hypothetical protein
LTRAIAARVWQQVAEVAVQVKAMARVVVVKVVVVREAAVLEAGP